MMKMKLLISLDFIILTSNRDKVANSRLSWFKILFETRSIGYFDLPHMRQKSQSVLVVKYTIVQLVRERGDVSSEELCRNERSELR